MQRREEAVRSLLGKTVHVVIDRPMGYDHHGLIYPVNYGYLPGILAGDGEEQDAYILGADTPLTDFDGQVIGIVFRRNDREDKLVVAPAGTTLTAEEIAQAVFFQEQFFDHHIEAFVP